MNLARGFRREGSADLAYAEAATATELADKRDHGFNAPVIHGVIRGVIRGAQSPDRASRIPWLASNS